MDYEQDYMMRMVKDMARMIGKILLGKESPEYVLPESEEEYGEMDRLYLHLAGLADAGEINRAENELSDFLESGSGSDGELRTALGFYLHINEFSNDFLDEHEYSREEIYQGVEDLSARFGVSGLNIHLPG